MKKLKIIKIVSIIIILTTVTFAGEAFSRRGRHRHGRGMMPRYRMLYRHLDDSDFLSFTGISRQKAQKIKSLLRSSKKQTIPILAKLRVLRLDYQELLDSDKLNKRKIILTAKKMHDTIWKLRLIHIQTRLNVAQMLTKGQRRKAEEFLRSRFRRRWRRRRMGPPRD